NRAGYTNTSGNNNIFLGRGAIASSPTISNSFWLPTYLGLSGGNAIYVTPAGQVRDTTIGSIGSGHTICTPSSGATIALVNHQINIINPGGGSLATLTVNVPSTANNNDIITIKFDVAITTLTVGSGISSAALPVSPTAGTTAILTYDSSTSTWY